MPIYEWKNRVTGETQEVVRSMADSDLPPDDSGDWERVFWFSAGHIQGAGGSPARMSPKKENT